MLQCGAAGAAVRCVLRCAVAAGAAFPLRFPFPGLFLLCDFVFLYPFSLGVRVCVCLLKMGLKNVSQWYLRGGTQCTAGFWKNVRGWAAVSALQEKCLTEINWKFGTAGIFGRGWGCSSELHC